MLKEVQRLLQGSRYKDRLCFIGENRLCDHSPIEFPWPGEPHLLMRLSSVLGSAQSPQNAMLRRPADEGMLS